MNTPQRRGVASGLLCAATVYLSTSLIGEAALIWTDVDQGSPLDFLHEKWGNNDSDYDHSYTRTWDLGQKCRELDGLCITNIEVWFAFADDRPGKYLNDPDGYGGDAPEFVDIFLGNTKIWDDLEVDGSHQTGYAYYSMVLDPTTHASVFSDLADDGRLTYKVQLQQLKKDEGDASWAKEDTYLKVAGIKAWCEPPSKVPDGGTTIAMLGTGLLGLAGLRRKLSAR